MSREKLSGLHIYTDHLGRTIYYDSWTKKGYFLTGKYHKEYGKWSMRMPAAIVITAVLMLWIPPFLCLGMGLGGYFVATYFFRTKFLEDLPEAKGFTLDPQETGFFKDLYRNLSLERILILLPLAVVLCGLQVYPLMKGMVDEKLVVLYYLAASFCGGAALMLAIMAFLKKREKN